MQVNPSEVITDFFESNGLGAQQPDPTKIHAEDIARVVSGMLALDDRAFRALAHRERRRLLRSIGPVERSVGDLAGAVGLDQPIASQHLRVLRDAGLVSVRADGNRRLYAVDVDRIDALRAFLEQFWSDRLARLQAVAERSSDGDDDPARGRDGQSGAR